MSSFRKSFLHQPPKQVNQKQDALGCCTSCRQACAHRGAGVCLCRCRLSFLLGSLLIPVGGGVVWESAMAQSYSMEQFPNSTTNGHLQDLGNVCVPLIHSFMLFVGFFFFFLQQVIHSPWFQTQSQAKGGGKSLSHLWPCHPVPHLLHQPQKTVCLLLAFFYPFRVSSWKHNPYEDIFLFSLFLVQNITHPMDCSAFCFLT